MRSKRKSVTQRGICRLFIMAGLCLSTAAKSADLTDDIVAILPGATSAYHFLHENPELGKTETLAHRFILERLKATGRFTFEPVDGLPTAIVAAFDTGRPGPVIALRAELDARRLDEGIVEPAGHHPRSQIDGLMHSCGHDVHAAILLGTAELIVRHADRFHGTIVFVFQPAEETAGGADDVVEDGVLGRLRVEALFALHVSPGLPVGNIAVAPGNVLAGSSYFTLKLSGNGSHAAAPFEGSDIPLLAARLALDLSHLPARHVDIASRPMVISVTRLEAKSSARNILPHEAEIAGTIRAFENPFVQDTEIQSIDAMLKGLVDRFAAANNVTATWSLKPGAPPTHNNEALFNKITPQLLSTWRGGIDTTARRGMFSEDFAYYTYTIPSLYFSLGIAKDDLGRAGVHTAEFAVHPDSLNYGIRLMTLAALIATTGNATWE